MANIIEGNVSAEGLKFGIAVARFNEFITSKLLGGALDTLKRHGGNGQRQETPIFYKYCR